MSVYKLVLPFVLVFVASNDQSKSSQSGFILLVASDAVLMQLNPVLSSLEHRQRIMKTSLCTWMKVIVKVVALFLHKTEMSLRKIL